MVKLNDVTLRDGQQSLLAGRVQQADLLKAADASKDLPYHMYEVWGGTCFDMPLKEKGENPFQNLREFRETLGENANLSMLLRCQNLVGYEGHDMSIIESFVEEAAKPFGHDDERDGINTFRIFDSLNDINKLVPVIKAVCALKDDRGWNVSAQGTLSYTVIDEEQRKDVLAKSGDAELAETLYTPDYYVALAKQMVEAGAESICIKDMAGLLDAEHAGPLVTALKEAVDVPIVLHAQSGLGLSDAAILEAIKAGVDEVDVTSKAMSGGAGHSATEDVLDMIERHCPEEMPEGFDAEKLEHAANTWRLIRPKYAQFENPHDPELQKLIQKSQVPGGMTTTLLGQIVKTLSGKGPADTKIVSLFLKASLQEMAKVREDVGYITLVTPSSQVVGTQAINHVQQAFYQLLTEGTTPDLSNIAERIEINRSKNMHLNAMTVPFAKLVMGHLGALPYQPADEIVARAEQLAGDRKLATLAERKAELRNEINALLHPDRVEGIDEDRRISLLQRRGLLSEPAKEKLERMAYEPTAQELLMYAIKPIKGIPELQTRLYGLLAQIDPDSAEKIGYGADKEPEAYCMFDVLSDERKIAVEKAATSMLELTRLKQGAIILPESEEKIRTERAQSTLSQALVDMERNNPCSRDALKNRFDTLGLVGAMHFIGRAVSGELSR